MTIMAQVVETRDIEETSDDEQENSEVESDGSGGSLEATNAGWADSIAKILKTNKPKGKKTLVLSKAKKLTDVKKTKTKPAGFEVETTDGEVKKEEIQLEEEETEEPQLRKKRRKELLDLRVKPNILEKDRERTLQKIATRGVVQLFNAVRMQQKDISKKLDEAGPLEVRKEKVLKSIDKREFLNVLMGGKDQNQETNQQKQESTWSVLRDDFMMGAKLKDWDKEEQQEETNEPEIELETN